MFVRQWGGLIFGGGLRHQVARFVIGIVDDDLAVVVALVQAHHGHPVSALTFQFVVVLNVATHIHVDQCTDGRPGPEVLDLDSCAIGQRSADDERECLVVVQPPDNTVDAVAETRAVVAIRAHLISESDQIQNGGRAAVWIAGTP